MYRGLGRVCTRGVGGLLPSKATEPWPPLNARNRHGEAIAKKKKYAPPLPISQTSRKTPPYTLRGRVSDATSGLPRGEGGHPRDG